MSKEEILERLRKSVVEGNDVEAEKAAEEAMKTEITAFDAIIAMQDAMKTVGEKFEAKEYFLLDLTMAGAAMGSAMKVISPHIKPGEVVAKGKVVFGTVEGDLHDIGKNMVIAAMRGAGFEVHDLGTDVPSGKFIEKVKKEEPDIVAMSSIMSTTLPAMERTIKALEEAKLREKVKIMVGGAPILQLGDLFVKRIGADATGENAFDAARKAIELIKEG